MEPREVRDPLTGQWHTVSDPAHEQRVLDAEQAREPREARKDEPPEGYVEFKRGELAAARAIGSVLAAESDPAVPRSDEPRGPWATDLTVPEKERLAHALVVADFRNWQPYEVADKIAGTVRAIAAARLAASPTTSAPAGDGLREALEYARDGFTKIAQLAGDGTDNWSIQGEANHHFARLRSALSARDDGLDVDRIVDAALGDLTEDQFRQEYEPGSTHEGGPTLWVEWAAISRALARRLSPSEPTAPTQD